MLNSIALTKIQSVIVSTIVFIAVVTSGIAFFFWNPEEVSTEVFRIGICGDLDNVGGKAVWQGAILAAEQVNAEGGVLGRQIEIVAEDDDSETPPFDTNVATNALTKLITVDKIDFIISQMGVPLVFQDICADHNTIFFSLSMEDELAQRVADDYNRYKGFFRAGTGNITSAINGMADCVFTLRDYTGFNKVAVLTQDIPSLIDMQLGMVNSLLENDFEIVYNSICAFETIDFSSYYAAVESSGAEMLVPIIAGGSCIPFVKEYHDRQSPLVVWGFVSLAQQDSFWDATDGKCEFVSFVGYPTIAGYPLTSKTIPTREAYIERWGEVPPNLATGTYDLIRFILPDAIRRAGNFDVENVIMTLESVDVETSLARHFVYTSTHDIMVGEAGPNRPAEDYLLVCLFQWQERKQVPVYPKEIMEEAGATYTYPDWPGPWDE